MTAIGTMMMMMMSVMVAEMMDIVIGDNYENGAQCCFFTAVPSMPNPPLL